jgi:hypothetical protein
MTRREIRRHEVYSYVNIICGYACFYGWRVESHFCRKNESVYLYFKHYSRRWLYCRVSDHYKESFAKECSRGNGNLCQVLCCAPHKYSGLRTALCLLSFGSDFAVVFN